MTIDASLRRQQGFGRRLNCCIVRVSGAFAKIRTMVYKAKNDQGSSRDHENSTNGIGSIRCRAFGGSFNFLVSPCNRSFTLSFHNNTIW